MPEVFAEVSEGTPIWFDDGKVGGIVQNQGPDWLRIRITHAKAGGTKLRAEKGINLPETELSLPAIDEQDLRELPSMVPHADMLALSFAQREADVHRLQGALAELDARDIGIVLKIETRAGFENLPRLLLSAMRSARYGVMIARGDLPVETGMQDHQSKKRSLLRPLNVSENL